MGARTSTTRASTANNSLLKLVPLELVLLELVLLELVVLELVLLLVAIALNIVLKVLLPMLLTLGHFYVSGLLLVRTWLQSYFLEWLCHPFFLGGNSIVLPP